MKLWADACVTPTLEGVAHTRGYEGTSNRTRGLLDALDPELFQVVTDEDWVLITNNDVDFRKLAAAAGLHPGLIILPQGRADQQRAWLHVVLDFIEARAADEGEEPWAWMVSRIVVYDEHAGTADWEWIPDPSDA